MAKRLLIHLSGFGEFHGVKFNPTEELIKQFPTYLQEHSIDSRIEIASTTVYETSAIGAVESFEQVLQRQKAIEGSYPADTKVFYLHLGVAATSETFLLEQVAWNEASFRCPDQRGWTPQDLPIIASNGTLTHCFKCQLPLDMLNEEMAAEGYPVKVSQDAGRFLCNYIYYHSLHTSNKNQTDSLFLHVPPFEIVPNERQIEFVRSLIQKIGRIYLEGR
jgi:pyroglutamyl-peptidase